MTLKCSPLETLQMEFVFSSLTLNLETRGILLSGSSVERSSPTKLRLQGFALENRWMKTNRLRQGYSQLVEIDDYMSMTSKSLQKIKDLNILTSSKSKKRTLRLPASGIQRPTRKRICFWRSMTTIRWRSGILRTRQFRAGKRCWDRLMEARL